MTREDDLIRMAKKLEKMVARNNTEGAMDLLKELKSFNMTLQLLQETRIGMSVNSIRKHCTDEEVIALAKVLIKEWKRLLDSSHPHTEKAEEEKNGLDSSKAAVSPNSSPRRLDVKQRHDSVPDANQFIKDRKEKHTAQPKNKKGPRGERVDEKHLHRKHLKEILKEEGKKPREEENNQLEKRQKHVQDHIKEIRECEVPKKFNDLKPKEESRPEWPMNTVPDEPVRDTYREKPAGVQKPLFERKNSLDSILSQPVKHHSTDTKADRRDSDSKQNSSPPAKKLTSERRESRGSKASQPGPPQRKSSTDHNGRKGKTEAPKTPTTPTSPTSPGLTPAGGPLPPHLTTGDSVRDKCIEMLTVALRTDNDYKDFGTNCDSMAAEIEDHIYQEIKATDMKYKNRVRSRISNLKDPKNPGLRRNVLAGSIDLNRIATMSAEEMASDELKQLRNVLTQEAIREHQMAKTGGTTTDLLQCGKCKKKNCTYNQVQTRSADEPMTTFVLCNECGNRWKFC
ncbi:transcription elongation factor A protein 3 isoform X1 [Phycodurus eques]|uniref:transcription elongation factor A protein 3 isoform X1 n=1 Tax=Phycodurus eques TaxID=693459 RepID=UPI002ACEED4B|nr:transcription elongation factor A protein 3 isoform X1 [Phycodurus eques]